MATLGTKCIFPSQTPGGGFTESLLASSLLTKRAKLPRITLLQLLATPVHIRPTVLLAHRTGATVVVGDLPVLVAQGDEPRSDRPNCISQVCLHFRIIVARKAEKLAGGVDASMI